MKSLIRSSIRITFLYNISQVKKIFKILKMRFILESIKNKTIVLFL